MLGNVIDLRKKSGIVLEKLGLTGVQANIVFAIDNSGSMDRDIENGNVEEQADRFIGIGMNMDPDKSIDVYTFNTGYKHIGTANENNHKGFVKSKGIRATGGTNYAPVMKAIIEKYGTPITAQPKKGLGGLFGKKEVPQVKAVNVPTLVFFMTDGDNFDKDETLEVIKEAAKQGIFWQFIGIGNPYGGFPFLEKLDDLQDRFLDNADFTAIKNVAGISDEALYESVLKEFPGWLKQAKAKGLVL